MRTLQRANSHCKSDSLQQRFLAPTSCSMCIVQLCLPAPCTRSALVMIQGCSQSKLPKPSELPVMIRDLYLRLACPNAQISNALLSVDNSPSRLTLDPSLHHCCALRARTDQLCCVPAKPRRCPALSAGHHAIPSSRPAQHPS